MQLDCGAGKFNGDARWLAVSVCCPAANCDYELQSPRQPLTAAPYALYAAGSWQTTGNSGTTPGTNYLGTNDEAPLQLRVKGANALRLEPAADTLWGVGPNLVGGAWVNQLTEGVVGATIAGGGSTTGCGEEPLHADPCPNRVTADFGAVGGRFSSEVSGAGGTVGRGEENQAGAWGATVGGGGIQQRHRPAVHGRRRPSQHRQR